MTLLLLAVVAAAADSNNVRPVGSDFRTRGVKPNIVSYIYSFKCM